MSKETIADGKWTPSVLALLERYYPHYSPHQFSALLARHVHTGSVVLEIGAGSGRNQQIHFDLRGKVARYVGVDLDPNVLTNPFLDESYQANAAALPFPADTFDIVFHSFVAEHFADPLACNREIARVLKPGGVLLFHTPSRYYYPSVVARITPHWFHEFYVSRMSSGRSEKEVFPTFYRLNDSRTIKALLTGCGFSSEIQHHSIPPGYLRFSAASFLAGVLFERTVERWFPSLRGTIFVVANKTG
jgi:SAM-dependent methyltransferase